MIRHTLPPLGLLLLIAGFVFWNHRTVMEITAHCIAPLEQASAFADAENWAAAEKALSDSYAHWQSRRGYLRITATHSMVDAADSMYLRIRAFLEQQEPSEFQAETAELRAQLLHMAETEGFRPENIF